MINLILPNNMSSSQGSMCQGNTEKIQSDLQDLSLLNSIVVTSLVFIQAVISLVSTIIIFSRRTCKEIPVFVTLQMICLNIFWLLWAPYCIHLILTESNVFQQNGIENFMA